MSELKLECFEFQGRDLELQQQEDNTKTFSGVAYSGSVIPQHGWMENIVIDLEDVNFKDQIPIFHSHNNTEIIGFGRLYSDGNELKIQGKLIKTRAAEDVFLLAENGFKWELSVGMAAEDLLQTDEEFSGVVNGRLLEGQHNIFKIPRITETSFVAIGADKNTHASVFSKEFWTGKKEEPKKEFTFNKINETKDGIEMEQIKKLEDKLELALKRIDELETEKKLQSVERKFEGLELESILKGSLTDAFMGSNKNEIFLAEHILKSFEINETKEEVVEPVAEKVEEIKENTEEVKEEAVEEKVEDIKEEVKKELQDSLPKTLFTEEKVNDEVEKINRPYTPQELNKQANKIKSNNPGMSIAKAIFEAKKLFNV